MIILCNACGHEQELQPITDRIGNGIERTYLLCEYCGKQYTSFYTDRDIRKLQEKQRRLAAGMPTESKLRQFKENKERLGRMMAELKARVEGPPA